MAFGVSRATVREAIRRLRGEGLLDARRGSGTFVVQRQLDAPILGTSGLAQAITAAGLVEMSRVLRIEEGPAGETAARALGTDSHEMVQWVERLRYADGEPLALDLSALAIDAAQRRAFVGGDLTQGSLYGLLETLLRSADHWRQREAAGSHLQTRPSASCCGPAVAKASSRWSASPTPPIARSSGVGAWFVAGAT